MRRASPGSDHAVVPDIAGVREWTIDHDPDAVLAAGRQGMATEGRPLTKLVKLPASMSWR